MPERVRSRPMMVAFALTLLGACVGDIGRSGSDPNAAGGGANANADAGSNADGNAATGPALAFGPTGIHRLSRIEYDSTLRDLLGDNTRPGLAKLPEDVNDPFDNDYKTQLVSGALIASVETLATDVAARAIADPPRRDSLVGCTPTSPSDKTCFEGFVRRFGRRAFRRDLIDAEVASFVGLQAYAIEAADFFVGAELVIRAMLQDPSFLYRVEIGDPVAGQAGVYRLTDFEIGSRLSYFLWGSMPSDELLNMAAAGSLRSADGRRAAAANLLADPRGADRVRSFHSFWLGYRQLALAPDLADALHAETDALVTRVVLEQHQDYLQIFRSPETFLTDSLAAHYGLPTPGSTTGKWVNYGSDPRRGILSHGAVLAVGAKFDDTSPTLRGVFVRNRLLCQVVPPPPPTVMVDQPPMGTGSRCKIDRYAAHRSGACAGCHSLTDGIGFGLENYDRSGAYRTTDMNAPECTIPGDGEVVGLATTDGKFKGPAALGELLIASGVVEQCVVTQLFRMALGRRETDADTATLIALTDGFKQKGRAFDKLLVEMAADPAFIHRRLEQ